MLTQSIDLDDPILAFTHTWVEKLAQRVESLYCVGLAVGRHSLDQFGVKVFSLGKERGYRFLPDLRYLFNLYRILREIERDGGVDVIFSHMAPVFSIAVAPYAFWRRLPVIQWYAHPSSGWRQRIAHHLSSRVVTSLPTSYPYIDNKVTVIGHGIDADFFSPDRGDIQAGRAPLILYVGRLSPVKDLTTLLHGTARLLKMISRPFRVIIVGGPATLEDETYVSSLKKLSERLDLDGLLSFEGSVPHGEELVNWYRRCTVHVNLTPLGFGDKVMLEAMSCGKISLAANEGFREVLGDVAEGLLFPAGDHEELAKRLFWALSLDPEDRTQMGFYLRERVIKMHGLDRLMDRLVELFKELQTNPTRA